MGYTKIKTVPALGEAWSGDEGRPREACSAPCVGSSPAGTNMGRSGDPGEGDEGKGGRVVFSKVLFERSLAERVHQADKGIPGRRNSMSKGMGFSLDCKALGVAGAEGMCGGGQERRTQGRQGQLVLSLTRHSRRDGALSCRPQGVPGFVEWREVTRCAF